MAWIPSHQSLARHRKTLEVVAALHCDRHKLIGHLHELWWWGVDNADTGGRLGRVPPTALANAAGWPTKDAQRFADALCAAGFVDRTEEGGYVLHDWFDYAGRLNEQRARNRERKAEKRSTGHPAPVRRTDPGNPVDVPRNSGAREEERREQKRTGDVPPPVSPPPQERTCSRCERTLSWGEAAIKLQDDALVCMDCRSGRSQIAVG